MASTNKVFISFALRDIKLRDQLLEQLNKEQTGFTFVDMPVKQSWEPAWKEECREKVTDCDGVIGLVTKNIVRADGQLWELSALMKVRCLFCSFTVTVKNCLPNCLTPWASARSTPGLPPLFRYS